MAGRRHGDGRLCLCEPTDGTCAGLVVRRLSRDRVRELAEEIWTASSGDLLQARSDLDPRSSRAGASAQAAYRRHRERERAGWRLGWARWTAAVVGAAAVGDLVVGLSVGAWLGWITALLLAAWTGWRLRFRPSPGVSLWRRQAAMQRRAGAALLPLAEDGYLVLHDVTLPGWLDGLDHLVVGPAGVWVVGSWPGRRLPPGGDPPPGSVGGLSGQARAVAETLEGWARVPVRALLCVHSRWPASPRAADGVGVGAPGQLSGVVRSGPAATAEDLARATTRLLAVLRPAA
jgi:hypothetical protein